jgi:hypothetical protein
MSKSKTNALDALRALIAERQQYDQWISTLESKRGGTAESVFNRVYSDYRSRLDGVLEQIRGHSEELQSSITALAARLGEVAKEQDAKRDAIQESELRAAIGEYDVAQWESMRAEAGRQLEKIGAERASLEGQLAELESIRKLSEVTAPPEGNLGGRRESAPVGSTASAASSAPTPLPAQGTATTSSSQPPRFTDAGWPTRDSGGPRPEPMRNESAGSVAPAAAQAPATARPPASASLQPAAAPAVPSAPAAQSARGNTAPSVTAPRPSASPVAPPPTPTPPPKKGHTPPGKDSEILAGFSKPVRTPSDGRPEMSKTLKCPECGTANYPAEWYCERCGGELATM